MDEVYATNENSQHNKGMNSLFATVFLSRYVGHTGHIK